MPREPTLQELIRSAIDSRMLDVHTRLACRVKTYDSATQCVDVELVVKGRVPSAEADDGSTVSEALPVIPNVPVEWPSAGGYYFHLPIAPGDEGIVSFFESAIGHFRETGEVSEPGDLRRHSMSSATFVPVPLSKGKRLASVPADAGQIAVPSGKYLQVSTPGGASDFVALKGAIDAIQQNLDTLCSFGTPFGPTAPGNLAPAGAQVSSNSLKAGK